MPTVLTNNKIECGIKDNKLIVSLNFEEDDEVMYVAFRKGNELKKIVTPDIHNMTAEVDLSDTEYDSIDVYVWNGNMQAVCRGKANRKIKENPIEFRSIGFCIILCLLTNRVFRQEVLLG